MKSHKEFYEGTVSHTLASLQILELRLKDHISLCYEIISESCSEIVPFKYTYKDIENHSLERLCSIFGKMSNNSALTSSISKLIKHRNDLAHRALLPLFGQDQSEETFKKMCNELVPLMKEVNACVSSVTDEFVALSKAYEDKLLKIIG